MPNKQLQDCLTPASVKLWSIIVKHPVVVFTQEEEEEEHYQNNRALVLLFLNHNFPLGDIQYGSLFNIR